ncbi:MAG: hypothetical protein MPJ25_14895, partial [Pirellulales bacterium]|nr:hypothetical protein [Pirellulales bacterium]
QNVPGGGGSGNPYDFSRNRVFVYERFNTSTSTDATTFWGAIRDVVSGTIVKNTTDATDAQAYNLTFANGTIRSDFADTGRDVVYLFKVPTGEEVFIGRFLRAIDNETNAYRIFGRINDTNNDTFNDGATSPTAPPNIDSLTTAGTVTVTEVTDAARALTGGASLLGGGSVIIPPGGIAVRSVENEQYINISEDTQDILDTNNFQATDAQGNPIWRRVGDGAGTGETFASPVVGTPANIQLSTLANPNNVQFNINTNLSWSNGQLMHVFVTEAADNSRSTVVRGAIESYNATTGAVVLDNVEPVIRGTIGNLNALVTPVRVFGAGAQGDIGPQGPQGVGIITGQTLDPTVPISAGTNTEFTIDLVDPANVGTQPTGATFTVPPGARGLQGVQGPRGAFVIEAYTTAATAPLAPQAGTGVFNEGTLTLTTAPTANTVGTQVTWRTTVADAVANR